MGWAQKKERGGHPLHFLSSTRRSLARHCVPLCIRLRRTALTRHRMGLCSSKKAVENVAEAFQEPRRRGESGGPEGGKGGPSKNGHGFAHSRRACPSITLRPSFVADSEISDLDKDSPAAYV